MGAVLHNEVQTLLSLYDVVELNDVRVSHYLEDVYLPCNALHVAYIGDFLFLQYFDGDFLLGVDVNTLLHLAKSTLSKGFDNLIVPNLVLFNGKS